MSEDQKTEAEKALERAAKDVKRAEKKKQILAFAKDTLGCDKQQAKVFSKACKQFLKMDDDGLRFKGMGGKLVSIDSPECKAFFQNNYGFLLKAAAVTLDSNVTVDPSIVEQALAGSVTAKGKIAKAFGAGLDNSEASRKAVEQTERYLKAENAKRTKTEGGDNKGDPKGSNPWSPNGWNLTKQMAVYRSDPAMAARLSKAAGSYVGATHPAKG